MCFVILKIKILWENVFSNIFAVVEFNLSIQISKQIDNHDYSKENVFVMDLDRNYC